VNQIDPDSANPFGNRTHFFHYNIYIDDNIHSEAIS